MNYFIILYSYDIWVISCENLSEYNTIFWLYIQRNTTLAQKIRGRNIDHGFFDIIMHSMN